MQKESAIYYFTIVTNPKALDKTITAFIFIVMQYGDNIKELLECADRDPDIKE